MRAVGSIVAGFSTFLGCMIAFEGMPAIGVTVGMVGGVVAGYVLRDDVKHG